MERETDIPKCVCVYVLKYTITKTLVRSELRKALINNICLKLELCVCVITRDYMTQCRNSNFLENLGLISSGLTMKKKSVC